MNPGQGAQNCGALRRHRLGDGRKYVAGDSRPPPDKICQKAAVRFLVGHGDLGPLLGGRTGALNPILSPD